MEIKQDIMKRKEKQELELWHTSKLKDFVFDEDLSH